ncbi:LOW QUALITY PROTEIN: hypothetical protein QBC45DRAFT_455586 [Copromyces sp. CBS 386.78]|nr:LOW QUALITY PROTEIN: hypothetical protein QBC45DRAFT_455586 [Copromyces sp. CBS 386.78]
MLPNASRWRLSGRKAYKWVSAPAHAILERSEARQTGVKRILLNISVCSHTAPARHTSAVIQARQAEDAKDEMRDVIHASRNAKLQESEPKRTSG